MRHKPKRRDHDDYSVARSPRSPQSPRPQKPTTSITTLWCALGLVVATFCFLVWRLEADPPPRTSKLPPKSTRPAPPRAVVTAVTAAATVVTPAAAVAAATTVVTPAAAARAAANLCAPSAWRNGTDLKGGDLPNGFVEAATAAECCGKCAARGNCVAWTLAEGCWLKGARSAASPNAKLVSGFIAGRVGVDAAALKKLRAPAWVGTTPQEKRRARTAPFACRGDRATALDGERHLYAAAPAADWSEAYPLGNGALGALLGGEPWIGGVALAEESLYETRTKVEKAHAAARAAGDAKRAERAKAGKATPDDARWARRPKTPRDAFASARAALLDGDVAEAHEQSRWLDGGPVASFMGLATLRFVVGGDAAGAPRPPEPPRDPKKKRPPRSLAAELALVARSDAVRGYARSLDVRDAVFEASFEARNETRRLRAFASRPDAVLALRFDCAGPDGACAAVEFGLDRAGAGDAAALPAGGGSSDVVLLASAPAGDDLAWAACAVAVGAAPAAVAPDLDPSLLARVFGAETPPRTATRRGEAVVVLVAGATSYDGADPRETCVARLAGAARRGWDDLRGRHVADFRAAAGKATLRLADAAEPRGRPTAERVERLGAPCGNGTAPATAPKLLSLAFAYGRYLLASSSRRGGLPANLQGVWADGAFFGVPARFGNVPIFFLL